MIYNLVQYLVVQLPALDFVADGFGPNSPVEATTIKNTGGNVDHWYNRSDDAIQILSRAKDTVTAYYNINLVYELLKNRYHLELPSVTVKSILYAAIQTYQISPVQKPGYIGSDDENLEMYSFNITVTTK